MKQQHGFTLVELSIVLVILGLLVGGVLTGQSLIRAAELRSVSTQYNGFITATQTFRDKYFALPGDMINATAFWGIAGGSGSDATCNAAPSTDSKTCNGNGDGMIAVYTGSDEPFRFWQQLANAGLIEGSYNGVQQGTNPYATTSANSPVGKMNASLWFTANYGYNSGNGSIFDGQYDNSLEFGALYPNEQPIGNLLKPEDLYNIDTKMDDGKPATGKIVVRAAGGIGTCADTSDTTNTSANYLLSSQSIGCAIIFPRAF